MCSDQCSWTHYNRPLRVCTRRGKGKKGDSHLVNAPGVAETPPLPRVRFAYVVARVTASALGRLSAKARTTILRRAFLVHFVNLVAELRDRRARDSRSCSRETSLDDIVRDVALELAGYVHQVEGHDWAKSVISLYTVAGTKGIGMGEGESGVSR
jgi:hypothetical protein